MVFTFHVTETSKNISQHACTQRAHYKMEINKAFVVIDNIKPKNRKI